jgi:hypothetical protein
MRRLLLAVLALAVALPTSAQSPVADDPLVQRFLDRQDAAVVSYRGTRRLEASNERFKKHGWMDVAVELSPDRGFIYTVLAEGGSGYIRDKVLRKALSGEAAAVREQEPTKAALTPANYLLASAEGREDGLSAIRIRPRRSDMFLVDGVVTVTADADIVRVEGRLAKTPSFWTRRVDVVRHYGRVEGIRVPLGMESTAEVRIAGRSTFRMTSTYQEINGIAVAVAGAP